ncbi:hypothetical protein [Micromonospora sp. NPDC004704]
MGDDPVDPHLMLAHSLAVFVFGALSGVVLVLWVPSSPVTLLLVPILSPVGLAHLEGVRHRWWALGAGAAVGLPTGQGVEALLTGSLGTGWAALVAVLVGSAIGITVHAAVTHLPRRTLD